MALRICNTDVENFQDFRNNSVWVFFFNEYSNSFLFIQARDVNPNDYDRKIEFWSDMVAKSCDIEKNAIFTIDILKRRFRRGDQIPGSLNVIIQHMLE